MTTIQISNSHLPTACAYRLATDPLPPMELTAPYFLEYILAGNGLFVRSARRELEACFPIASALVGGSLPSLQPSLRLTGPPVPASMFTDMLEQVRQVLSPDASPVEHLFYLHWTENQWQLIVPPQAATSLSVRASLDALDPAYRQAVLEVHSHHYMRAFFSAEDDQEELGKFRLFAVLGRVRTAPEIKLRVGLWTYFWNFPARTVFELPEGVCDGLDSEPREEID